ncbi:MAG: hypothetical protein AAGF85_13390 [Bacteroidota bacterium]
MKKLTLIIILMAGVSFSGKGQHFYASFGIQHNWGVPFYVTNAIYDHYWDYNWVHASRIIRNGRPFYDIVLRRGDLFLEVRVSGQGFIRTVRSWDAYPFVGHVCSSVCGFHSGFYRNSYTFYDSHNFGYRYRGNSTVIINNHYKPPLYRNNGKHYRTRQTSSQRKHVDQGRKRNNQNLTRGVVSSNPERRKAYRSSTESRSRVNIEKRSSNSGRKSVERDKSEVRSGRVSKRSY